MKTTLLFLLTITILLVLTTLAMGQPGLPNGGAAPTQAPIDGGLGLLAAAGGAYAWKKLKNKKDQDNDLNV